MATEHYNKLTEPELERLTMLFEDCSEIIHAVGKIIRHGYTSHDPTKYDIQGINNRDMLSKEIGQLLWIIEQMKKANDLEDTFVMNEKIHRSEQAYKYIHHFKIL